MRVIFLLTVQHTGTWWCINTLRTHPQIEGFAHIRNVVNLYNGTPLAGDCTGNPNNESISKTGVNLFHTHWCRIYEKGRWQWDAISDTFVCVTPTIMPLRDPLLSLLTRNNRDSWMYPHGDLLEEWIRLAQCKLPIEFFRFDELSMKDFAATLNKVGLDTPEEWLTTVSKHTLYNTSGEYALKDAYNQRDVRYIKSAVPELWSRLTKSEYLLRPFLAKHGYRNLIWWHDYAK